MSARDDLDWVYFHQDPNPVTPFIGPLAERTSTDERIGSRTPQAFLVSMPPPKKISTHFHDIAQFQYFAYGSGSFARHKIQPGVAHYVDAFTPYGPVIADNDGCGFFTLRAISNKGAYYMPESRNTLAAGLARRDCTRPRRNITVDLVSAAPQGTDWLDLVSHEDGLRISVMDAMREESALVGATSGDGAYVILVEGTLARESSLIPPGSIAWRKAGSVPSVVTAGPERARLAVLQLPFSSSP